MEWNSLSAVLRYTQENATITVSLSNGELKIDRTGDYGMSLLLRENESTVGTLSIAGNEGALEVYTERLAYSITKNRLLMQIYYTLNFGTEKQNMRLRINASQTSLEEK
jgi:uncharacterized beta-barrel protein YwiB (DUF1934 family)